MIRLLDLGDAYDPEVFWRWRDLRWLKDFAWGLDDSIGGQFSVDLATGSTFFFEDIEVLWAQRHGK